MKPNKLREKLISGQVVFGGFIDSSDLSLIEILGHAGYDFVVLDMEHSSMDMRDIESLIRAADAVSITPIVRIGEKNCYAVSRVLDAGAQGVMVPHVMSPEDAKGIVELTRYPPAGSRPACSVVRATQYTATSFSTHIEQSNKEILFFALIEDASAVDSIDQILDVPGIDVIIPGLGDLSTSLNVAGNFEHPLVIAKVEKVIKSTLRKGKPYAGMYVRAPEQAERWINEGVKVICYAGNFRVIFNAYREILLKLRSFLQ